MSLARSCCGFVPQSHGTSLLGALLAKKEIVADSEETS